MKRMIWGITLGLGAAAAMSAPAQLTFDIIAQQRAQVQFIGAEADYGANLVALDGDFNGDGRQDPVMAGHSSTASAEIVVAWPVLPASGEITVGGASSPGTRIFPAAGLCGYLPDMNSDGCDELLVSNGGPNLASGQPNAYIIYGSQTPPTSVDLSTPPSGITTILSARSAPVPGALQSIATVGDFNGDALRDVVVGDPALTAQGGIALEGRCFLISGQLIQTRPATITLTSLAPPLGFPIEGASPGEADGTDVAGTNINQDAFADIVVSGQRAYVIFGGAVMPPQVLLASLGTGGVTFNPALGAGQHFRLGSPGNLSPAAGRTLLLAPTGQQTVYLVQSSPAPPPIYDVAATKAITDSGTSNVFSPMRGASGDLNNDRFPDLVLGEVQSGGGPGQSQLLIITNPFAAPGDIQGYVGRQAIRLRGQDVASPNGDQLGLGSGVADMDGDGFPDLLISAPRDNTSNGVDTGSLSVVFFRPPHITAAYHFDSDRSGTPDAGERVAVEFDQDVVLQPLLVTPTFFNLTGGGDSFGAAGFLAAGLPFSGQRLLMRLGTGSAFTVFGAATEVDVSASGFVAEAINSELGVNVTDLGTPDADDSGVDMQTPVVENSGVVTASLGGTVTVANSPDALYTGHSATLLPNATGENARITLGPPPVDLGLATATQIVIEEATAADGQLAFSEPITVTLEYREADHGSALLGQREDFMRVCELVQTGPASYEYQPVPGAQSLDMVNNLVSAQIAPGLTPPGRARRGAGSGATPLAVSPEGLVGTFASLPIETVDERDMWMGQATGGRGRLDSGPPAVLVPGLLGEYLDHVISFPGYEELTLPTTTSLHVTIRSALFYERTGAGSEQYFPDQSFALFTVEITDFLGSPVAFTDPVDLVVQYIPRAQPTTTDVVDFTSTVGYEPQMRVVRSLQSGPPDFALLASGEYSVQTVDTDANIVGITGVENFTDSDGVATYGVVVDPSAPSVTSVHDWSMYR